MLQAHCVNLSVLDLDAVSRWYENTLNFTRVSRTAYPEMGLEIAFLRQGEFEIELISFAGSVREADHPDPPKHARVRGITHFAFRVADIDEMINELTRKEVPVLWGPKTYDEHRMKVIFVRDPEGNLVKFVERLA
ncbi:VOC family protein [Burkholderia sp. S171]|jgi:catechol 2,3-dioxygenase-like lactoylglutathione lyase family enzyme|uniref:VOC family protein n=1 Tax=Burkholderia sp. S171 TaxID=1641860 RepID=UPI00131B79B7|nr:VOC family protein [Burkholderia sp. S171]